MLVMPRSILTILWIVSEDNDEEVYVVNSEQVQIIECNA